MKSLKFFVKVIIILVIFLILSIIAFAMLEVVKGTSFLADFYGAILDDYNINDFCNLSFEQLKGYIKYLTFLEKYF